MTKRKTLLVRLLFVPSALLFLALAFQWSIIDLITPFLWMPLIGGLWLLFLSSGIISLVLTRKVSREFNRPFLAFVAVMFCACLIPFTTIWLKGNFWLLRAQREKVATEIFAGKLLPNVAANQSLIKLPRNVQYLSAGGGDVVLSRFGNDSGVYFFTFCGILGNSSGYLFMNSDITPQESDFVDVEKVAPRWYWVQTE